MSNRSLRRIVLSVAAPLLIALVSLCAPGCRTAVQQFPLMDPAQSIGRMAQRQREISTIEAIGSMELESAAGDSVRLDTAMVALPPTRMRIRGWKFDRAVFDVTLLDSEVWIYQADAGDGGRERADFDIHEAARGLEFMLDILAGSFYESAALQEEFSSSERLVARGVVAGTLIECTIDRRTLTAREFKAVDETAALFVSLDDYRMIGELAWPFRVHVCSPEGQLHLQFDEVEINGVLSTGAFLPPAGAVQRQ